jgi:hypothetical protein
VIERQKQYEEDRGWPWVGCSWLIRDEILEAGGWWLEAKKDFSS